MEQISKIHIFLKEKKNNLPSTSGNIHCIKAPKLPSRGSLPFFKNLVAITPISKFIPLNNFYQHSCSYYFNFSST